jgi:site-specific recombinase XerD
LCEFRLLWQWLLAHRPITSPTQVDLKDLWAYQTDQHAHGYAAGTINRRTDYILGLLRQLAEGEQPVNNSVFRLRYLRRPLSLPKHLTEAESQRLEAHLKAETTQPDCSSRQTAACMLLMLHSGLRSGECIGLSLQDLDLPGKRLIVRQGKGQRDRLVYLSEDTCQAMTAYLQDNARGLTESLWLSTRHKPLAQGTLAKQVKKTGKIVGIDNLYPHRLRHTCATRLLNAGMDITRIQKLLGHEMISTTMIYAKVQDATVETDFQKALHQIELRLTPLSNPAVPVLDWPTHIVKVQNTIDDSV